MNILSLISAVVWVDIAVIALSKFMNLGKSLNKWYAEFGITAFFSDCLVIILGIMLAQFLFPAASGIILAGIVVCIQLIHDLFLYYFVILPLPQGTNKVIDLFKQYSAENSWKILVADASMVSASVLLMEELQSYSANVVTFIGLLGFYAATYFVYTK